MLLDTNLTIAYRCAACGSFKFFSASLFKVISKKEYTYRCSCNSSGITITKTSSEDLRILVPCIGCGETHKFVIKVRDLLLKSMNVLCCDKTKVNICYIGDEKLIRQSIDILEKGYDKIMSDLGYKNSFKNTRVMYETLNKIQDIADKGNLYCECGNTDAEIFLFSDRVELRCTKCQAIKAIRAVTNEDLKDTLGRQYLVLLCEAAKNNVKF